MPDFDNQTLTQPDSSAAVARERGNDPTAAVVEDTGALKADMAAVFSAAEPFSPFTVWMGDAEAHELNDPNAMTLATVRSGVPDARIVLLKGHDARGFVFYTNLTSAKGQDIASAPNATATDAAAPMAALCFHWKSLRRQIRVKGRVEAVTAEEADAYYASRARGSRLGAWASPQSTVIESRAALEAEVAAAETRFEGVEPPRPPHWSGFRVVPERIEFWQDGAFRLHDRCLFTRDGDGWRTSRLAP